MELIHKEQHIETMQTYRSGVMFFIPMVYSFKTRYKGKVGFFAWLVKYFIPVLLTCVGLKGVSVYHFFIGMLYLYSFYEIGYIYNDCETIKKEKNPTLRISEKEEAFYEHNKYPIFMVRCCYAILFGCLLFFFNTNIDLLVYGFLTLPVFILYNRIRSGICLFIHLILMMLRYTVPVFIAINRYEIVCFVYIFFLYPLTLFVERSVKGKFGYKSKFLSTYVMHTYEDRYVFRLKYYLVIFIASIIFYFVTVIPVVYIVPPSLFLLTSWMNIRNTKLHYNK